jgi:hypothetical protein
VPSAFSRSVTNVSSSAIDGKISNCWARDPILVYEERSKSSAAETFVGLNAVYGDKAFLKSAVYVSF